jgi:hypothetical protein
MGLELLYVADFYGNRASGLRYGYVGAMIDMAFTGSLNPGPSTRAINQVD